jgi:hypothetical protein
MKFELTQTNRKVFSLTSIPTQVRGLISSLSVVAYSETRIDLTWVNGCTNEDGIAIERGTDGINYVEVYRTAADATSYSNTGLTEDTLYYYRIRAFNSSSYGSYLSSSVRTINTEAMAFITAAGIADGTQKGAIRDLVNDLVAINTTQANFVNFATPANSVCLAIYPFVGGTATTHKYNLINPVDSNAAFRLTFSGHLTHDATGIKGGGATPDGSVATHLSTDLVGPSSHGVDVFNNGPGETGPSWSILSDDRAVCLITAGDITIDKQNSAKSNGKEIISLDKNQYNSSCLLNLNRLSNNVGGFEVYRGGIKSVSTEAASNTITTCDFSLLDFSDWYSAESIVSFASIRQAGISEAAMLLYIDAIYKYENNLGRLSKKNIVFSGHSFMGSYGGATPANWFKTQTVLGLNTNYANRILSYDRPVYSGGYIANLIAEKATYVDPLYNSKYGIKNIIVIWIGTNDINNTVGCGATTYALLKAYYNSLVADGWITVVCTMTEYGGGAGQQEAERVIYNGLIRTDLNPTYLLDTDLIVELADSNDATYFVDTVHLTSLGNKAASDVLIPMIAGI